MLYQNFLNIFWYVFSFFCLIFAYSKIVGVYFSYMGFTSLLDPVNSLLALFNIIFLGFVRTYQKNFSRLCIDTVIVFLVIPSLVLFSFNAVGLPLIFFYNILTIILITTMRFKLSVVKSISVYETDYLFLIIILTMILSLFIILDFGFFNLNFNLLAVYDYRDLSSENLSTLSKYLFSSISKVLLPIALIASVYSKKWFYSLSVIFVAIILTGVSSHKSVIFLIILALTVYFLSQNNLFKNHVVIFLLIGIIFLSLLDLYVLRFFYPGETPLFGSWIVRRGLFAAPMNDQAYLVFFQSHDWIYWSDS